MLVLGSAFIRSCVCWKRYRRPHPCGRRVNGFVRSGGNFVATIILARSGSFPQVGEGRIGFSWWPRDGRSV